MHCVWWFLWSTALHSACTLYNSSWLRRKNNCSFSEMEDGEVFNQSTCCTSLNCCYNHYLSGCENQEAWSAHVRSHPWIRKFNCSPKFYRWRWKWWWQSTSTSTHHIRAMERAKNTTVFVAAVGLGITVYKINLVLCGCIALLCCESNVFEVVTFLRISLR